MDRDRLMSAREAVARHGAVPLGQERAVDLAPPHGRFGRMFPSLQPCNVTDHTIDSLVASMRRRTSADNPRIPAGFTYLGQFIDHDLTHDPTPKPKPHTDPRTLVNFRTPRFDLDSVYGSGPLVHPFLYDWKEFDPPGTRLLVGRSADAVDDLPRNCQGRALIGDPRNYENVIVAQLHLLFIRFHNAVVDRLSSDGEDDPFEEARRIVRWHYQWIVVHEFLEKVVGRELAHDVLTPGADGAPTVHRMHFSWRREPFIPVEFSGAAYRFGHSMVRGQYSLQRDCDDARRPGVSIFPGLAGFRPLCERLVIDWERFFKLPGREAEVQDSLKIDTAIARQLFRLPEGDPELPRRNLLRGSALGLPSGQDVACVMHVPALGEEDLLLGGRELDGARRELRRSTPLWYYILCEAGKAGGPGRVPAGRRLGPVGGRIVAEVLVGLLEGDPTSYLGREPTWRPEELGTGGDFKMADLVDFVRRSAVRSR